MHTYRKKIKVFVSHDLEHRQSKFFLLSLSLYLLQCTRVRVGDNKWVMREMRRTNTPGGGGCQKDVSQKGTREAGMEGGREEGKEEIGSEGKVVGGEYQYLLPLNEPFSCQFSFLSLFYHLSSLTPYAWEGNRRYHDLLEAPSTNSFTLCSLSQSLR